MEKVLIVDDEKEICEILKFEIEDEGFQVYTAYDGSEGLSVLDANPDIKLVISDVKMPNMDGVEFLTQINDKGINLKKFIFITGFSDLTEEKAEELGADRLVSKPLQLDNLISYLRER